MWISTGRSRKETKWKNQETTWEKFVERLKTTKYTDETHEEYLKLSKQEQDKIKDVGGFIGGTVLGGRRLAGHVTARSVLTLDVDKVESLDDFISSYELFFNSSGVIYSTHKHSPDKPRIRLIVLLDREVQADAYEAIARKVAETINIEEFDPTTFQPERLMYWPSTSKESKYLFKEFKGRPLNTDLVLNMYRDWTDSSKWPTSKAMNDAIKRHMKKQGDPTEKPGIIGTFCRVYSITEAIEKFLSETYLATDKVDRYTYAHGTTSAGVVVYDDKWSYSHHSTDPCTMKLCNSWDLVRIHLFGKLDDDTPEDVPGNKLPSFVKMTELAGKDKQVKRTMLSKKITDAKADFKDNQDSEDDDSTNTQATGTGDNQEPEDESWIDQLETDKTGKCLNTIANAIIVLENDSLVKDCIKYNDFDKRIVLNRSLPWRKLRPYEAVITDSDDAGFRNYFEQVYGITVDKKISDAIDIVSKRHQFHPVRDYLNSLEWDGEERLGRLLIDYLGAEDTKYTYTVTRKAFIAAVTRIMCPGVKFDHVLTTSGIEGAGKSFLLQQMGMGWHSDSFGSLQNKEAVEQVQGVWLMEIGELFGLKKAESEAIKLFLSKREDRFRVAYGRRVEVFPRQCVFFGTTNEDMFLKDPNGNRRFWPVKINPDEAVFNVFKDLTQEVVDQQWAEAYEAHKAGERLFLTKELEDEAKKMQRQFREQDERVGIIQHYLSLKLPLSWNDMSIYDKRAYIQGHDELLPKGVHTRTSVSVPEIWVECLGNNVKDMSFYNTRFIRDTMQNLEGWKKRVISVNGYGTQRGYVLVTKNVIKCN